MLRSRNFLFSPLWCSSLIQVEFHFFWGQNKVRDLKSNSKRCKRVGSEKNISHLKCLAGVRRSTSVDWSRQRFTAQQRIDCTERVMTGKTPMGCHSSFRLFFFFFCDQRVSIIFGLQLTADMILVLVCRYGWKIQLLFWSIYSFYFVYRLWFIIFASCKDLWQAGAPLSGRKTHPPWISVDFLDSMIFLPTIVVGNQHSATTWGTNMN